MRIIAGKYKGLHLTPPRSSKTRPTQDHIREAVFSILHSYILSIDKEFKDFTALDLFAGTGALGIEALSRGVTRAVFIDIDEDAIRNIQDNIKKMRIDETVTVLRLSSLKPPQAKEKFNLIFLDPPYGKGLIEKSFHAFHEKGWFDKDSLFVIENSTSETLEFSGELEVFDQRDYRDVRISLAKLKDF